MDATDAIMAFLGAMAADGIEPVESIANQLGDGKFTRFVCKGDRAGKANGWARLFLDRRPAGRYGNHRLAVDATWKADVVQPPISPAERLAARVRFADQRAERERERAAGHEAVAVRATALMAGAGAADPAHPYLVRKRIAGEGMGQRDAMLLVPMTDSEGRIWNVQRIFPDGTKLFLKGGRIDGLFWSVETGAASCDTSLLCIGEGVGTMAAVRRATGHDVAAAFSAANLEPVARALRSRWPARPIVICADDDTHLVHHPRIRRNLGVDAAKAAAAAIGARIALPPRSDNHG